MKIWSNTSTLEDFSDDLTFTEDKTKAEIILMGSKSINLDDFPKVKGIFRAGVGRDNVPEQEALHRGIKVRFPSQQTSQIIYEETANFTVSLILKMMYLDVGSLEEWSKNKRKELSKKKLLILGLGNIGKLVESKLKSSMELITFDVLFNNSSELEGLMNQADCLSIHIPSNQENDSFIDKQKLSWLRDESVIVNTARGQIVSELDLLKEIESGRLRAAFDVFWKEPYKGELAKYHPNRFHMTPHIASTCQGFLAGCRKDLDALIEEIYNG